MLKYNLNYIDLRTFTETAFNILNEYAPIKKNHDNEAPFMTKELYKEISF